MHELVSHLELRTTGEAAVSLDCCRMVMNQILWAILTALGWHGGFASTSAFREPYYMALANRPVSCKNVV